jgi:hypothetical protein
VLYGFSPKVFDDRMHEHAIDLRSYSAGINGNVPEADALMVRRIGDAYNHAHRRVSVMMITFGPWAFADWFTGENPNRNRSRLVKNATLLTGTGTEIASLFLHDLHYASELLGVRILGGFGAPDSIGLLGERMFGGPINGAVSPSGRIKARSSLGCAHPKCGSTRSTQSGEIVPGTPARQRPASGGLSVQFAASLAWAFALAAPRPALERVAVRRANVHREFVPSRVVARAISA